jgi:DNA-binding NtrC family response regulator
MSRSILIVEDDPVHAEDLRRFLADDFDCVIAGDGERAVAAARRHECVAALVDLHLGAGPNGFDIIVQLREIDPRTAIIVVTSDDTEASLQRARDLDVQDYIHKSVGAEELRGAVRRSLILRRVTERVRRLDEEDAAGGSGVIAQSAAMKRVASEIELASRHRAPVLITGPVGAGKMLVARRIHELGRRGRVFERVHCATLDTGELADSQLFGFEPGAHSTAKSRFIGALERAEDGTLLLDDIDYLPLRVQVKLLQPLEERVLRRLPGSVEVAVRCRILASTNKNLEDLVAAGSFQADLLSRLRGAQVIHVPGIEERGEDLTDLIAAFAVQAAREMGRRCPDVTLEFHEAVRACRLADVRQLLNAIRYAVGVCDGDVLSPSTLPSLPQVTRSLSSGPDAADNPTEIQARSEALEGTLDDILDRTRREAVRQALVLTGGDKKAAASRLNITVQWLNAIMRGRE